MGEFDAKRQKRHMVWQASCVERRHMHRDAKSDGCSLKVSTRQNLPLEVHHCCRKEEMNKLGDSLRAGHASTNFATGPESNRKSNCHLRPAHTDNNTSRQPWRTTQCTTTPHTTSRRRWTTSGGRDMASCRKCSARARRIPRAPSIGPGASPSCSLSSSSSWPFFGHRLLLQKEA